MPEISKSSPPPDGRWGWVVCLACFTAHALTDGIIYSFGILFVELLEYYNERKGNTALIASLCYGVCLLSGPINAANSNRFGHQRVVIVGTCIMVTCFITSIFAPNIYFLYATFGIAGWGYGMVILPSLVCLTKYFEKRRAFAVGLGVSGSGIGTFVSSLLTRALIDAYTWKGALLIQSGLILNCLACGLVYLPLNHPVNRYKKRQRMTTVKRPSRKNAGDPQESTPLINKLEENLTNSKEDVGVEIEHIVGLDQKGRNFSFSQAEVTPLSIETGDMANGIHTQSGPLREENMGQMDEKDEENNPDTHNKSAWAILSDNLSLIFSNECENDTESTLSQSGPGRHNQSRQTVKARISSFSFNFRLFTNRRLALFIVSTFLAGLGYFVPYVYLPVKAQHSGIHRYAWLVSAIGIANTVGRVGFGFISDKSCVNRLMLFNTALVLCGVGTVLCPLFNVFETLVAYAAIYGLFSGVIISLTTVIITDFVGTEMLADVYGARNFTTGLATLLGTPLAGWLFDMTGNYTWTFVAAGVSLILAGAIMYAVPFIKVQRPIQF